MKSIRKRISGLFENGRFSTDAIAALAIAAVLVVNIILCYVVQSLGWYFYAASYSEDFSISGKSDELFREAKDDGKSVTITFLMERDSLDEHATGGFVLDTVEQFRERYGDFIKLRFVNTFTKLDEFGNRVDLEKYKTDMVGNEVSLSRTAVIFESSDGNYRTLSNVQGGTGFVDFYTFNSAGEIVSFNGETIVSSMISWVLTDEHKTVYVTANHAEQNDPNFATLLAASGYYISGINLQDSDVPDDAAMVVISNPKNDFERAKDGSGIKIKTEIERLREYVERGGSLFVSLDPYVKRLTNLEDFIAEYGIELSSGTTDKGITERHVVRDIDKGIMLDGYTLLGGFSGSGIAEDIANTVKSYSDGGIILREVAALKLSGAATPVLVSSESSELTLGGKAVDGAGSYAVAAHSTYEKDGNVANIFVIPSAYVAASDALTSNEYSNREFLYALFEHAFGAENLPYGANSVTYVADDLKNLTMGTARLYTTLLLAVPAALAAVGAVVIIRRKNR